MFIIRVLTGLGLIVLFAGMMVIDILFGTPVPALAIGTFLIFAAAHEFYAMARTAGVAPFAALGVAGSVAAFNWPWLEAHSPVFSPEGILAALVVAAFLAMFFRQSRANALADLSVTIFGAAYVGLLAGFIVALHALEGGARVVLYAVTVSKLSDIGGYLAGRFFGRHKLAPVISPNKTIEGSAGAVVLSLAAAFSLAPLLPGEFSLWWTIAFGLAVNAAAQFGDLAESIVKRSCGVKDSATFLPGVCGALDLIDSVLISAPVAYAVVLVRP